MKAWTQLIEPGPALATLCIAVIVASPSFAAPAQPEDNAEQSTEIEYYPVADATGCYYNFQHYDEGDRIITNEPCLNCTCHNRMLMCYLRVCPFTKAIGANCKVEKRPDQCCPVITCPEVPVQLVTSTAPSTALGHLNEYGCSIEGLFYSDGARVPSNPENPCELCYCIRNKTACVMQECTLNVEGCRPVFQEGVCCPVRYNCEHPDYLEGPTTPQITTTSSTTTTTTTEAPTTTLQPGIQCEFHGELYNDGELVKKDIPCEKCYCMRGDIVCAVQECGPTPLDKVNCTALPVREGQCCPDSYDCAGIIEEELTTLSSVSYETEPTTISVKQTEEAGTEQPLTTVQVDLEGRLPEISPEGTEAPKIPSEAPTTVPIEASEVPEAATEEPKGLTKEPELATAAPEAATGEPEAESRAPEPATGVSEAVTQTPSKTPAELATAAPEAATGEPEEESKAPEPVTEVTGPVTQTSSKIPAELATAAPEAATEEPEAESKAPEPATGMPGATPEETRKTEVPEEATTPRQVIEEVTRKPVEAPLPADHAVEITKPGISETTETASEVIEGEKTTKAGAEGEVETSEEPVTRVSAVTSAEEKEEIPRTTEGPVEAITSRVSEVIEAITTRVTEAMEVFTTAISGSSTELPKSEQPTEEAVTRITAQGPEEETPATSLPETDKAKVTPVVSDKERPEEGTAATPSGTEPSEVSGEQEQEIASTTQKRVEELPETSEPPRTTESQEHPEVSHDEGEEQETELPAVGATEKAAPTTEKLTPEFTTTISQPSPTKKTELEGVTGAEEPERTEPSVTKEAEVKEAVIVPEKCGEQGCARVPAAGTEAETKPTTVPIEKATESPVAETKLPLGTGATEIPPGTGSTEARPAPTSQQPDAHETEPTKEKPEISTSVQPSEVQEPTTTPVEEIIIVTEIPTKKTEMPESMDHVSETAYSTDAPKEAAANVTAPEATIEGIEVTTVAQEEKTQRPQKLETQSPEELETHGPQEAETHGPQEAETRRPQEVETHRPQESETQTPSEVETQRPTTVATEALGGSEAPSEITRLPQEIETQRPQESEAQTPHEGGTQRPTTVATEETGGSEAPSEVTKPELPSEEHKTVQIDEAATTELPREEENEIELDDIHSPGPKIEEHVTEAGVSETTKSSEQLPITIPSRIGEIPKEEAATEEQITEKPVVPEVCTSETECAPSIPSVPKVEQPSEATSISPPEEGTEPSEGTTESNKIPEEPTEETNEIPESGTEAVAKVTEVAPEIPSTEGSGAEISTEPSHKEEGSGEEPQEGSGATPTESHDVTEPEVATQPSSATERLSEQTTGVPEVHPTEPQLPETTEYAEQTMLPEREIPGEGSCLVDGQTYKNNSAVPPINHCQATCRCVSSILRCESIECTPPPSGFQNCSPIFSGPDSCCPTYSCTGVETTPTEPESQTTPSVEEFTTAGLVESEVTTAEQKQSEITTESSHKPEEEATEQVARVTEAPQLETEQPVEITSGAEPGTSEGPQEPAKPTEVTKLPAADVTSTAKAVEEEPQVTEVVEEGQVTVQPSEITTEADLTTPAEVTKGPVLDEEAHKAPEEAAATTVPIIESATATEKILETVAPEAATESQPETGVAVTEQLEGGVSPTTKAEEVSEGGVTTVPRISEDDGSQATTVTPEQPEKEGVPQIPVESDKERPEEQPKVEKEGTEAPALPERIPSKETEEEVTTVPSDITEEPVEHVTIPEETVTARPIEAESHITVSVKAEVSTEKTEITESPESVTSERIPPKETEEGEEIASTEEPVEIVTMPEHSITPKPIEAESHVTIHPQTEVPTVQTSESPEAPKTGVTEPLEEPAVTEKLTPVEEHKVLTDTERPVELQTVGTIETEAPGATTSVPVSAEADTSVPLNETAVEVTSQLPTTVKPSEEVSEEVKLTVAPGAPEEASLGATEVPTEFTTERPEIEKGLHEEETEAPVLSEREQTTQTPGKLGPPTAPEEGVTVSEEEITEQPEKVTSEPSLPSTTVKPEERLSTTVVPPEEGSTSPAEKAGPLEAGVTTITPGEGLETSAPSETEKIPESDKEVLPAGAVSETGKTEAPETRPEIPSSESAEGQTSPSIETEGTLPTEQPKATGTPLPGIPGEGQTEASETPFTEETRRPEEAAHATTEQPKDTPAGETPAFTSLPGVTTAPTIGAENVSLPVRTGELFTSGPEIETTTKQRVPGELSTSVPVSEPTTVLPATTSTELPPAHIPGEQAPEPTDYEQPAEDYDVEDQNAFGPGTCRYGGKVYVSAQQIPRDDPCDFCFCFRSDIICLQQSCPPPIPRCHEEPIRGFCCPRYECPVSMATSLNVTTSTTTTTTTLPPHFLSHAYKGRASKTGCQISGKAYQVGEVIRSTSGPCLNCTCGGDGQMKCDPKPCSPEPMLRQMIAAAALRRRR